MAISRLLVLVAVLFVLLLAVVPLLRADAAAHAGRLRGAAVVVVVSVGLLWMLVNRPVEGPILFTVARTHGMTVADIPSVALFAVAGWIARPWRRRVPGPRPATSPRHAAPARSSSPAAS